MHSLELLSHCQRVAAPSAALGLGGIAPPLFFRARLADDLLGALAKEQTQVDREQPRLGCAVRRVGWRVAGAQEHLCGGGRACSLLRRERDASIMEGRTIWSSPTQRGSRTETASHSEGVDVLIRRSGPKSERACREPRSDVAVPESPPAAAAADGVVVVRACAATRRSRIVSSSAASSVA